MSNKLKPIYCGCGGEAKVETDHDTLNPGGPIDWKRIICSECNIRTTWRDTEDEAIEAWNKAMGERSAKVMYDDASVTDANGYKYYMMEYFCDACKKRLIGGEEYCPKCGAKLEWE